MIKFWAKYCTVNDQLKSPLKTNPAASALAETTDQITPDSHTDTRRLPDQSASTDHESESALSLQSPYAPSTTFGHQARKRHSHDVAKTAENIERCKAKFAQHVQQHPIRIDGSLKPGGLPGKPKRPKAGALPTHQIVICIALRTTEASNIAFGQRQSKERRRISGWVNSAWYLDKLCGETQQPGTSNEEAMQQIDAAFGEMESQLEQTVGLNLERLSREMPIERVLESPKRRFYLLQTDNAYSIKLGRLIETADVILCASKIIAQLDNRSGRAVDERSRYYRRVLRNLIEMPIRLARH